jgi:hypothetical protein
MLLTALASVLMVCLLAPAWGLWGLILAPGLAQIAFVNWWIVLTGAKSLGLGARNFLTEFGGIFFRLPAILKSKV